jgi:hypothetical protein
MEILSGEIMGRLNSFTASRHLVFELRDANPRPASPANNWNCCNRYHVDAFRTNSQADPRAATAVPVTQLRRPSRVYMLCFSPDTACKQPCTPARPGSHGRP